MCASFFRHTNRCAPRTPVWGSDRRHSVRGVVLQAFRFEPQVNEHGIGGSTLGSDTLAAALGSLPRAHQKCRDSTPCVLRGRTGAFTIFEGCLLPPIVMPLRGTCRHFGLARPYPVAARFSQWHARLCPYRGRNTRGSEASMCVHIVEVAFLV